MKIIVCMCIDKEGHVKYITKPFKPSDVDICVTNYDNPIADAHDVIYYNTEMQIKDDLLDKTCWTSHEVADRIKNKGLVAKVFVEVDNFYDYMDEVHFAFRETILDEYDIQIDIEEFKNAVKGYKKEKLGSHNGFIFYKYIKQ